MSYFGGVSEVAKKIDLKDFLNSLSKSDATCKSITGESTLADFAENCTNDDLMKICIDRAKQTAQEGPNMAIIIGIVAVLLICCCIYCCCSSSGVYYWNKNQTTKQETK